MSNSKAVSRAATVLLGAAAMVVLMVAPSHALVSGGATTADPTSVASGTAHAENGSVASGSGTAINDSVASGDAVAIDGSVASGCSTAVDGSTASGGCDTTATTTATTKAPAKKIAFTGASSASMAAIAGGALAVGAALVALDRRRGVQIG